ncbi:MAG TPA: uroporphyrinogen-III synthase [Sediminibacterium sp.]|nr:uroporphyrinogen-III synthase [Sediminibacterium sp.]
MAKTIHILYTGQFPDRELPAAMPAAMEMDCIPFIRTVPNDDPETLARLKELAVSNATVVLTSQKAVEWMAAHVTVRPNWKIACMEGATFQRLQELGWDSQVNYTAGNGLLLAKEIAKDPEVKEVFFLGSKLRLGNLPNTLRETGVVVHELVAYNTLPVQQELNKSYDGIVFLSPSAVDSFFEQYETDNTTVFFAIGATTANAVKKYTGNKVVVAENVLQETLFQTIYNYYQSIWL